MPFWHRLAVVAVVLVITLLVGRLIARRIFRRDLSPEQATRYRVLRRTVSGTVVFVGILSALLVIPQGRTVRGGRLASPAILGLVLVLARETHLSAVAA